MSYQIVRPPTLLDTVVSAVRDLIYRGDLQPGEPLREVALSEMLNVSRITIREALRSLKDEGLVEVIPYKGAFVRRLSPKTSKDIYIVRALLEPYAVRLALEMGVYTQQDLDDLQALVHRMGELENKGDYYGMIQADVNFHLTLCKKGGNSIINAILDNLQSLNVMFMLNTQLYKSDQVSEEQSHQVILQAVQQGDPEMAEAVIWKHIVEAGDSLMKRMSEVDWDALNVHS